MKTVNFHSIGSVPLFIKFNQQLDNRTPDKPDIALFCIPTYVPFHILEIMFSTTKSLSVTVILLFSFVLSTSKSALSQVVNVERHRITADTVNILTGGFGVGLNVSQNKSQIVRINNSADLTYISRYHDYILLGRNNFLRVEGDNVLNDGFIHLRSVLFRDNTYAPELFLQAQYNLDWGLKRRALAGAAIRIRFRQTETFSAFASTGLMYENEIWEDSDGIQREVFGLLKSTTSINIRGNVTNNLQLAAISYYQARPDRILKPRFTSDWQLRFRISENLRFVFQFVSTYDSEPRLGSTDFIYNINNLLEVRF